jgi:hypothetical protein
MNKSASMNVVTVVWIFGKIIIILSTSDSLVYINPFMRHQRKNCSNSTTDSTSCNIPKEIELLNINKEVVSKMGDNSSWHHGYKKLKHTEESNCLSCFVKDLGKLL